MKKSYAAFSLLLVAAFVMAACTTAAPGADFKACQVTDTGGIDDKSFNATAWKGIEDAVAELGVEGKFLESQQQTDYEANVNAFVEEQCDIIITVGFLLGDATAAGAAANPEMNFSIVDFAYDPIIPNVLGQVFSTNEAAFLAGYAAAASTQTGKVGTFGGIQIPPVAGPVGLGTAAAVQERGSAWIVGVDNDWAVVNSDYASVILTSVLKNMDVTTLAAIRTALDGTFQGGVTVGTLANGGVGLAPLASAVPAGLQAELDQVKAAIIAGSITTLP